MLVQEVLNKRYNRIKVKNDWEVVICDYYKVNPFISLEVILKDKKFLWKSKKIDIPTTLLNKNCVVIIKDKDLKTATVFIKNI